MAEKLHLGTDVHELKIGKSFGSSSGNAFHTIRYDFKPVSVDSSQNGLMQIDESGKSVTVTFPHQDGIGNVTYSGQNKEANKKDCLLIIDHKTGEISLEKLTNQILLKKTRTEGASRIYQNQQRPSTPVQPAPINAKKSKKGVPASRPSPDPRFDGFASGETPPDSMPSNLFEADVSSVGGAQSYPARRVEDGRGDAKHSGLARSHDDVASPPKTGLSDSSSDSASSSGSDSDSPSDIEEDGNLLQQELLGHEKNQELQKPIAENIFINSNAQNAKSMPNFLNDDLQLSESGSECD